MWDPFLRIVISLLYLTKFICNYYFETLFSRLVWLSIFFKKKKKSANCVICNQILTKVTLNFVINLLRSAAIISDDNEKCIHSDDRLITICGLYQK